MKLAWEVVHYDEPDLARIQARTMEPLPCGCDYHYTAVPVDVVETCEAALDEVVQEFQRLHETMGCPHND